MAIGKDIQIGGYTVLEKIGEGSYGEVWKVKDTTGGEYALKCLLIGFCRDGLEKDSFEKEANSVNITSLPFMVKGKKGIFDYVDGTINRPCYLMELMADNLKERLRIVQKDDMEETKKAVSQLSWVGMSLETILNLALFIDTYNQESEVTTSGKFAIDLHPANIHYTKKWPSIDGEEVKLSDLSCCDKGRFSTSIIFGGYLPHPNFTTVLGNGPWMGIHSLCKIAYEMLTGRGQVTEKISELNSFFKDKGGIDSVILKRNNLYPFLGDRSGVQSLMTGIKLVKDLKGVVETGDFPYFHVIPEKIDEGNTPERIQVLKPDKWVAHKYSSPADLKEADVNKLLEWRKGSNNYGFDKTEIDKLANVINNILTACHKAKTQSHNEREKVLEGEKSKVKQLEKAHKEDETILGLLKEYQQKTA